LKILLSAFTKNRKAGIVLIVLGIGLYCSLFQGSRGLWESDEGRYSNIALHMLNTKNFLLPMFNDDVMHFSKPPMTYWAIAGGMALLGRNEWGTRMPNAAAFFATILLIFGLAKVTDPDRPWLSPLVYATSILPFVAANYITTDTILTLWETLAVFGFVKWWNEKTHKHGVLYLDLMWFGFGLAFLTKGPPGLLPLLPIMVFLAVKDGKSSVRALFPACGILLFFSIGLGWYLIVAARSKELIHYFLVDEFIKRITTVEYHRNPEWYKPFVIYIPAILIGITPWNIPLIRVARKFRARLFSFSWYREKLAADHWNLFLALWIVLPFTIFFLSRSRLLLYILPLFVPISLIISRSMKSIPITRKHGYCIAIWILLLLSIKHLACSYHYGRNSRDLADVIRANVKTIPSEVVFVNTDPYWGLSVYLGCEVERASTFKNPEDPTIELMTKELRENEDNTLYIFPTFGEPGKRKISMERKSLVMLYSNDRYKIFKETLN